MIGLHVVTGFLGAGKTTLLRALLQAPNGERIAVLVNEVGELAIDQHLLERLDDDVLALTSGCLCCSLRGDLLAAISRILSRRPDRIVLETSGAADPMPILATLADHPQFGRSFELASVITVADASRIDALLDTHPETARQLQCADRIVLTHLDAAAHRIDAARERLATIAPAAQVCTFAEGDAPPADLLTPGPTPQLSQPHIARRWLLQGLTSGLHDSGAGSGFRTHSLRLAPAANVAAVQLWLRLVAQLDGRRIVRIKGLVRCAQSGACFVLQGAGAAVSPPRRLQTPPPGLQGVEMVLIERGASDAAIAQALAALRSAAAGTPADERAAPS